MLGVELAGSDDFAGAASVAGGVLVAGAVAFFRSAPVTGFLVMSCAPAVVETTMAMTAARLLSCNRMVLSDAGYVGHTTKCAAPGCSALGEPLESSDGVRTP
jgi:hypothetical protein